ncbi:MAG: N-formylglutamate amidohydrolase [Alphaproteobacteria bacterium]
MDHASNAVPACLGNLGLPPERLQEHIAVDIGAAAVGRLWAERFDAPLVLSGFSRLVIDCNRMPEDVTSIATESDGIVIPGNARLNAEDAAWRKRTCFDPYHDAIAALLDARHAKGVHPAVISVHSFTPVFGGAAPRPWHIGILWNKDPRLAHPYMAALRENPALKIGDNQPYSAQLNFGYSIRTHGEGRGLPHMLIELRQDLVAEPDGAAHWAKLAGDALARVLREAPNLNQVRRY